MKKSYGLITIMLTFAIVCVCATAKAYSSPNYVALCMEGVKYGQFNKQTTYYTKNRGSYQSVRVDRASTALTNPCPNCQIGFKLAMSSGVEFSGAAAKMGETQSFSSNTTAHGDYRLKMMRADFTLLDTSVDFTWNLNI